MKKTFLYTIIYIAACLAVPYIITMLMSGTRDKAEEEESAKQVILNYDKATEITDVTDYVTRTVAAYYKSGIPEGFCRCGENLRGICEGGWGNG